MRTKNSMVNVVAGLVGQGVALIISYIARRAFIDVLSEDYLGINGLFTNILTMLSLVEIGIGPAIVYSLYKPLAEKNVEKVKVLMRLFQRAYILIGILVLILGLVMTPFIQIFMESMPNVPYIRVIFLLFVANTAISYFFSYRRSLIIADQRRYVDTITHYGFYSLLNIAQIIFLYLTRNYFVFLGLQIGFTLLENIVISYKAKKMYPFLKEKTSQKLDGETRQQIIRNTSAMIFHKVGGIVVGSTDNLLISAKVGVWAVGFYSNYQLVINALKSIITQVFQAMTASIGNLGATESKDKALAVFKPVFLMNFWIYSFCSICMFILFNPFIELSFGKNLLFGQEVVFIMVLNFYLTGMRQAVLTFRDAFGIYWQDRFKPLFEAAINLVVSFSLANAFGVFGIFIGTAVSTLTTCFWIEPYILYKYAFDQPVRGYFLRYGIYTLLTVAAGGLTLLACSVFETVTWFSLLGRAAFCLLIPNGLYFLIFHRTEDFRYLMGTVLPVAKSFLSGLRGRLKGKKEQ